MHLVQLPTKDLKESSSKTVRQFARNQRFELIVGHKMTCKCKGCQQSRIKYLTPYGGKR